MNERHPDLRILFAILWLGFTIALAAWMMFFNLEFISRIEGLGVPPMDELQRHSRMVLWEMLSLILSLIVGGVALFYLILRERARAFQIQKFFATFTHELKTSLSRIRLQAEGILDDFKSRELGGPALQLLEDLGRLEVQLENSLFLARGRDQNVFIQELPLSKLIANLSAQFPLQVSLKPDVIVKGDLRILESVLKNLMQNAVVHGGAQSFRIVPQKVDEQRVRLLITDDGGGFQGDRRLLGQLFSPQGPTGGSGLGLSLAGQLLPRMQAELEFLESENGFRVALTLPGRLPNLPQNPSPAGGSR